MGSDSISERFRSLSTHPGSLYEKRKIESDPIFSPQEEKSSLTPFSPRWTPPIFFGDASQNCRTERYRKPRERRV